MCACVFVWVRLIMSTYMYDPSFLGNVIDPTDITLVEPLTDNECEYIDDLDPDDDFYTFESPSKYWLCDEFNNEKSITERKKHCFSMLHFNSRSL